MSPAKRDAESTEQLRATLIAHAGRIIARDGPAALTMRALAVEAGCAVGLPYKVFSDRHELVVAIVHAEFATLMAAGAELHRQVGAGTVGGNLGRFADVLLNSPAVALVGELMADHTLMAKVTASPHGGDAGPVALPTILADYLAAEQRTHRIREGIDTGAFGFLIAGALHNLVVAGEAWPRPERTELNRILHAAAAALAPAT